MKPAVLITLTRGADMLAHALLDRADLEIINYHDAVLPFYESRGVHATRFLEFFTEEDRVRVAAEAEQRAARVAAEMRSAPMQAGWQQYAGDPDTWERFAGEVATLAGRDFLPEIVMIDALLNCASRTDLRLLIVQQDISRDTRTLIAAAQRLGIPTLHTLHGYPYGALNAINLSGPSCADYIAVFSEPAAALFESLGVPRDRIAVTGNFEWDPFCRPPRAGQRAEACANLKLDPARPVITYALTYTHRFSRVSAANPGYVHRITNAVLHAFADLARRHPDWQFVLRPHPNDADAPSDLENRARDVGLPSACIDIYTSSICSVHASDLIVCCQSNLGIEAILGGKPVVNCVIDEFAQAVFDEGIGRLFLDSDAVIHARTPDAIAPAVEAALLDADTREAFLAKRPATARRFSHLNDGKATDRLCSLILHLAERGRDSVPAPVRWPEYEPALARAAADCPGPVTVAGVAAPYVAARLQYLEPERHVAVSSQEALAALPAASCPVLVLADPVPATEAVEHVLATAGRALAPDGTLVALFIHGGAVEAQDACAAGAWAPARNAADATVPGGQHSYQGLRMSLSRSDLLLVEARPQQRSGGEGPHLSETDTVPGDIGALGDIDAWVVRARRRPPTPGAWGEARQERLRQARAANARGEAFFAEGRHNEAAAEFAAAIALWEQEALFHNNVAATLHAIGRVDEAWKHCITALHFDPNLQSARDNLRELAHALGRTDEAARILNIFGADAPDGPDSP
ncbi:MAG: hypothetical protein JXR94_05080 [Candidatus Hydrogenedentes bacterium]|nr:hypothetical protein [Candidatus Hydrogenedentota bacterium]